METCNTELRSDLKAGDTINNQWFDSLSAQTYVPGVAFTAGAQTWATDALVVSAYKSVAIYVNHLRTLGETLLIKLRKLRETLFETIRSQAQFGKVQRL